ncbi:MAG: hypothetical protein JO227_15155 [Acetobacteraceae bacterium]|nr:hypothetical protein [Acetobacteraceae bacterium]
MPRPGFVSIAVQDNASGAVDFLHFEGTALTRSLLVDYGLGPDWKVVANGDFNGDGHPDLVMQNQPTNQVDFLYLSSDAQLVGSYLSDAVLPAIHGSGNFGRVPGQTGPVLLGQYADGSVDFLAFNTSGNFVASYLPSGAVLPLVIGAGDFSVPPQHNATPNSQLSLDVGRVTDNFGGPVDDLMTQSSDGELSVVSFSGDIVTGLALAENVAIPGNLSFLHLGEVNPRGVNAESEFGFFTSPPLIGVSVTSGGEVQVIGQLPNGQVDQLFFDATSTTPTLTGSLLEDPALPGWTAVPGGLAASGVFSDFFPMLQL